MSFITSIEQICTSICSGGTPRRDNKKYYENGNIPWLNTKEISFNQIAKTERNITELGLKNSSAKWIPENSVIIAMYGATAAKAAINLFPLTTNQACCNLTVDPKVADFRFIFYWFKNNFSQIAGLANGGAQQNLSVASIKNLKLYLPHLEVQNRVADILWTIDQKINLISRINDYLYDYIDTLFGNKVLESVDKSWAAATLLDIANYKNGLAMQNFRPVASDPGLPVIKIKELGQGQCTLDTERCKSNIDEAVHIHDGDLIFSWSGTLKLDFWAGGEAALNQHLFKVTSNKYAPWFYFLWTKCYMQNFVAQAADRATTMGHIKRSALSEAEVFIPPANQMCELDKLFNPIIKQIISLKVESRKLAELRDSLLPKLMSGELDVSAIDVTQLNNHLGTS